MTPSRKILVVEDDRTQVALLLEVFAIGGYVCSHAYTGTEGLQQLEKDLPDLLLLDLNLPDVNGLDLLKHVRRSHPQLPCVFLSSQENELDIVLALELGAEDYILKPFKPRELLTRIKKILQRTGTTPATPGLEMRLETREARMNGNLLELSVKEFELLHHLVSHPGRTFSRNQLLTHFWADKFEVNDRVIDSHIRHLRRKLEPFRAELGHIKTHRGRGYSFIPAALNQEAKSP